MFVKGKHIFCIRSDEYFFLYFWEGEGIIPFLLDRTSLTYVENHQTENKEPNFLQGITGALLNEESLPSITLLPKVTHQTRFVEVLEHKFSQEGYVT